jgi:hypothetical protein
MDRSVPQQWQCNRPSKCLPPAVHMSASILTFVAPSLSMPLNFKNARQTEFHGEFDSGGRNEKQ